MCSNEHRESRKSTGLFGPGIERQVPASENEGGLLGPEGTPWLAPNIGACEGKSRLNPAPSHVQVASAP